MTDSPPGARLYRGQNADERKAQRRAQLMEAGLELFGTAGYAAVSIKQVCREAGLTERYFYESFSDREDLLTCVFNDQVDQLKAATLAALVAAEPTIEGLAAAGINAFVRFSAADRRRARVIFIEVVGISPEMERRRRAVTHEFAQVIAALGAGHLGSPGGEMMDIGTMFFAGGLAQLMEEWLVSDQPAALEDLTFVVVVLLTNAFDVLRGELSSPDVERRKRIAAAGMATLRQSTDGRPGND